MGFFVRVRPEDLSRPQSQSDSGEPQKDLELIMIANAKKMGLSLVELNEFTTDEFVRLVDVFVGDDATGERWATQADIDRLLG